MLPGDLFDTELAWPSIKYSSSASCFIVILESSPPSIKDDKLLRKMLLAGFRSGIFPVNSTQTASCGLGVWPFSCNSTQRGSCDMSICVSTAHARTKCASRFWDQLSSSVLSCVCSPLCSHVCVPPPCWDLCAFIGVLF